MSGTVNGGKKGSAKILARDPDFFKKIGAKGGKASNTGGFAAGELGRERARAAGTVGGTISRRGSKKPTVTPTDRQKAATVSEVNREYLALPNTHAADLEKDDEINEIAEKVTKDIMSYEVPKRPSFLDRFKKVRTQ